MAKSLDDLKKEYNERLNALKKEKEAALKKAKAVEEKKSALEKAKIRKQENHLKMILGGYLLAEIHANKDKAILQKIKATVKSEKDKKLLDSILG